jgi:hypothetical protein
VTRDPVSGRAVSRCELKRGLRKPYWENQDVAVS